MADLVTVQVLRERSLHLTDGATVTIAFRLVDEQVTALDGPHLAAEDGGHAAKEATARGVGHLQQISTGRAEDDHDGLVRARLGHLVQFGVDELAAAHLELPGGQEVRRRRALPVRFRTPPKPRGAIRERHPRRMLSLSSLFASPLSPLLLLTPVVRVARRVRLRREAQQQQPCPSAVR